MSHESLSDTVFVLLESRQSSPVAIYCQICRPALLPQDAVEVKQPLYAKSYAHREVVGQWTSEMHGTTFRLVKYRAYTPEEYEKLPL